jgi:hypothetical protein
MEITANDSTKNNAFDGSHLELLDNTSTQR